MARIVIVLAFALAGCSGPGNEQAQPKPGHAAQQKARQAAAARAAVQAQLHAHMQRITAEVFELAAKDPQQGEGQDPNPRELLGHLDRILMEAKATGELPLNDPTFTENLEGFIEEVGFVRRAVAESSEDLNVHGSVMGACVYCHELRNCRGRDGTCPDVAGL